MHNQNSFIAFFILSAALIVEQAFVAALFSSSRNRVKIHPFAVNHDGPPVVESLPTLFSSPRDQGCCSSKAVKRIQHIIDTSETIDLEGLPRCHLKPVIESQTRRQVIMGTISEDIHRVMFYTICFNNSSRIYHVNGEDRAVCMVSSTKKRDVARSTLHLDILRLESNAKFFCPPGKQLLALHDRIGHAVGATRSQLMDVSSLGVFRGMYLAKIRSYILLTLLSTTPPSLETGPTTYYHQFGYSLYGSQKQENLNKLTRAASYLYFVTIEELLPQISENTFLNSKNQLARLTTTMDVPSSSSSFSSLVRKMHLSSDANVQEELIVLMEGLFSFHMAFVRVPSCDDNGKCMMLAESILKERYDMEKML